MPSKRFVVLLACDATTIPDESIWKLARYLADRGMVWACLWGPDCERAHDLFDHAILESGQDASEDSLIITTWHEGESLDEAIWFFLNTTVPAEEQEDSCKAGLAVSVGNEDWATRIDSALSEADVFSQKHLGEDEASPKQDESR